MGNLFGVLLAISLVVAFIWGWISNIIWIVDQQVIVWSGEMIISAVGIFVVPLGSIMGLFVH